MNRRGFLKGLLATAAIPVIGADLIVRTTGPCNVLRETASIPQLWPDNWRYVSRIANIDCSEGTESPDIFALLARDPRVIAIAA